jgi:hypothetical protein
LVESQAWLSTAGIALSAQSPQNTKPNQAKMHVTLEPIPKICSIPAHKLFVVVIEFFVAHNAHGLARWRVHN